MTDFEIPSSFKGRVENFETPDWRPLEQLAADDALVLGQFMWMHAVRLEDGRIVHAYKHFETRRYLHLAEDLTAFDYHGETSIPIARARSASPYARCSASAVSSVTPMRQSSWPARRSSSATPVIRACLRRVRRGVMERAARARDTQS